MHYCVSLLGGACSENMVFYFSRNLDGLTSKDREVASLRRQVDATSDELTETGRQREVALRENRRLQDDLATMTRENQVCIFYHSTLKADSD